MKLVFMEQLAALLQPKPLITLFALLLLVAVLFLVARKSRLDVRMLSYGALCIAAAFILSYLKLFKLPNGGTITVASMLPMFVFAVIAGPWAGLTAGICYGLLQFFQDPYFVHPVQFLLDYPLAFAMLGLAGFFRKNLFLGCILGGFGRLVCHFLAGVVFFAEYANGQNVFLYSLAYNASYLVPDLVICLLLVSVPNVKSVIRRITLTKGIQAR